MHAAWCWRETPDATTNHDLFCVYSDDHGRTWKDNSGATVAASGSTFVKTGASLPVVLNFRGKLAIASSDNVYAILPDLRIAAAAVSNNFATWTLLNSTDSGRFFSYPLLDSVRLETEDKLTIYYPQKSSVNIWALDYKVK